MSCVSGLYVITDGGSDLLARVEQALQGGAHVVQYRDKSTDVKKRSEQANEIVSLCRRYNALMIVNDDIELARQVNADGVHVGKDDAALAQARAILGNKIIGVSCYNDLQLAVDAVSQGADYVAFGRFFPSKTKPGAVQADLKLLSLAKKSISVPVVAIGGINAGNARQIVDAGADAIAVIDAVFGAKDVQKAATELTKRFSLPS